jgi:hypothetical protein
MSRSNYDKPFFVDVGTSIAAVRCQSNMDVIDRFDHRTGKYGIEMAEKMCDRINAEVELVMAAKDAEIAKLRELVKELVGCFENWTEKYPPSEWSQMGQSWQLIEETVARAKEGGAK